MKRLYLICLLALLAAAGLIFFATSQEWVLVKVPQPAPLPDGLKSATGGDVLPGLTAVAIVLLAAVVAVAATRRLGRRIVGTLIALCGVAAIVLTVPFLTGTPSSVLADVRTTGTSVETGHSMPAAFPPWIALLGAVVAVAAGVAVAIWGPSWMQMGSKYEPPAGGDKAAGKRREDSADDGAVNNRDAWNALDHGVDPTD